jgi:hypothetical protein
MNEDLATTRVLIHPMTPEGAVDLIHTLIRQRDQARRIAAHLEAECARWTDSDLTRASDDYTIGYATGQADMRQYLLADDTGSFTYGYREGYADGEASHES